MNESKKRGKPAKKTNYGNKMANGVKFYLRQPPAILVIFLILALLAITAFRFYHLPFSITGPTIGFFALLITIWIYVISQGEPPKKYWPLPWHLPYFSLLLVGLLAVMVPVLDFNLTSSNSKDLEYYLANDPSGIYKIIGIVSGIASILGIYLSSIIFNETSADTGKMKRMIASIEDGLRTKPKGAVEVARGVLEFLKLIEDFEKERKKISSLTGKSDLLLIFDTPKFFSVYEKLPEFLKSGVDPAVLINIRSKVEILQTTTNYKFAYLNDNSAFLKNSVDNNWGRLNSSALSNYIEEIKKKIRRKKMTNYEHVDQISDDEENSLLNLNLSNYLEELGYSKPELQKYKAKGLLSLVEELPFQAIIYKDEKRNLFHALIIYLGTYNVENLTHPLAFSTTDRDLVEAYYSIVETFIEEQDGLVIIRRPIVPYNTSLSGRKKPYQAKKCELDNDAAKIIVNSYTDSNQFFDSIILLDEDFKIIVDLTQGLPNSTEMEKDNNPTSTKSDLSQEMVDLIVTGEVKNLIKTQYNSQSTDSLKSSHPYGKLMRLVIDVEQGAYFVGNIVTEDTIAKTYVFAHTDKQHLVNTCSVRFGYLIDDLREFALCLSPQVNYGSHAE